MRNLGQCRRGLIVGTVVGMVGCRVGLLGDTLDLHPGRSCEPGTIKVSDLYTIRSDADWLRAIAGANDNPGAAITFQHRPCRRVSSYALEEKIERSEDRDGPDTSQCASAEVDSNTGEPDIGDLQRRSHCGIELERPERAGE